MTIAALIVQQRIMAIFFSERQNLANKDRVIATGVGRDDLAVEKSQGMVKHRRTGRLPVMRDAPETFGGRQFAGGKTFGNVLLVGRQQIDGKDPCLVQQRMRPGLFIDADEHQVRPQGNRTERIDGQAMNLFAEPGRHDGDTSGEFGHDPTE